MENQIEQEMEHEMDTEVIQGFIGSLVIHYGPPESGSGSVCWGVGFWA